MLLLNCQHFVNHIILKLIHFYSKHFTNTTQVFILYSFQISDFSAELQKQTYRIVVTMDAFGNPLGNIIIIIFNHNYSSIIGFANDVLDGLQDLVIDGNVSGFVSGFGYGVTNSISKVG